MSKNIFEAGDTPLLNRSHPGISRRRTMAPMMNFVEAESDHMQNQEVAVHNAVTSIELLIRYLNEELEILRFRLRESGRRMRLFFSNYSKIDYGRFGQLCTKLINGVAPVNQSVCFKGDAAMIFNEIPMQVERHHLPKFTLNDLATVLTTDDVEDGIIHAYVIRSPAWKCLPVREKPESLVDEMSEFQLFNKPVSMAMTLEDEDDRLSLPSTRTGAGVHESLQSMEAQMAMLRKQLEFFMKQSQGGGQPDQNQNESVLNLPEATDASPIVSDDEGKGPSLCSPALSKKEFVQVPPAASKKSPSPPTGSLPVVLPPRGPPPPPPPPPADLFKTNGAVKKNSTASQESVKPISSSLRTPEKSAEKEQIVRPSVRDLCTVQLRKTGAVRSPGGTPLPRARRSMTHPTPSAEMDQGAYLSAALKEKFRSMQHNSFSEQEDEPQENSSIWDED